MRDHFSSLSLSQNEGKKSLVPLSLRVVEPDNDGMSALIICRMEEEKEEAAPRTKKAITTTTTREIERSREPLMKQQTVDERGRKLFCCLSI